MIIKKTYFISYLLFFLFFFAYHPVIYDLKNSVIGNELAYHAPLVFLLAAFLAYRRRNNLTGLLWTSSSPGSAVFFVTGLLLNLLGQAGGVFYLSQFSIPLTLYGMAFYLVGRQFARHLIFPLMFLLLAFPIPGKIYIDAIFPLKLLVTKVSGMLLHFIGYPVKIYGNILEISTVLLGVGDACSGLNSLMVILTLSIFYSYMVIKKWNFRLIIVLSMFPLIVIANIIRVMTTAVVAVNWGAELVEGKLHSIWGILVFVVAVFGLMGITKFFMVMEDRTPS